MMKKICVVLLVLAATVAAQAGLVPNGDFETIYKPGTTIPGTIPDGAYYKGIGPGVTIQNDSVATFDDGTTGNVIDVPGWTMVTGNCDNMKAGTWGGTDGSIGLGVFAGWGGPTVAESASPLSIPAFNTGEALELSADVYNHGGPVVLELLVDGVVIAPDSESTPALIASEWVKFTRTYNSIPAGDVKIVVGTRDDAGTGWTGNRAVIDNVSLNVVPEPATMALLGLGGLALIRRRK